MAVAQPLQPRQPGAEGAGGSPGGRSLRGSQASSPAPSLPHSLTGKATPTPPPWQAPFYLSEPRGSQSRRPIAGARGPWAMTLPLLPSPRPPRHDRWSEEQLFLSHGPRVEAGSHQCALVTHRDAVARPAVGGGHAARAGPHPTPPAPHPARSCLQTHPDHATQRAAPPRMPARPCACVFSELRQLQGILLKDDIMQVGPDGGLNTHAPAPAAFINHADAHLYLPRSENTPPIHHSQGLIRVLYPPRASQIPAPCMLPPGLSGKSSDCPHSREEEAEAEARRGLAICPGHTPVRARAELQILAVWLPSSSP